MGNPILPGADDTLLLSGTVDDGVGVYAQLVTTTTGGVRKTGVGKLRMNCAGTFHGPVLIEAGEAEALTDAAPGTLELAGSTSNTYTGEAVVQNGTVRLNKSPGIAIPGPLTIWPLLSHIKPNDVELTCIGTGGPPRILAVSHDRTLDKLHLEAQAKPGVSHQWQQSSNLKSWATFATGTPNASGLLTLDQPPGIQADRRLVQP